MKMPLGTEVGLGPGDNMLDEGPNYPLKIGIAPNFSAHVYCGKMA